MNPRTKRIVTLTACALAFCSPAARGQDAAAVDPDHYEVEYETDGLRVLRARYGPGERSVMHSHPPGLLLFLTDGEGTFAAPGGKSTSFQWKAGDVERTPAVTHLPENTGDAAYELLVVELADREESATTASSRRPIIDMHLHAYGAEHWREALPHPAGGAPAPETAAAHLAATLGEMERHGIVAGVVSGPLDAVAAWRRAAPDRFLGSPLFGRPGFDGEGGPLPDLEALAGLYRSGELQAMAEVTAQYEGLSPSDPALDPYFALAEELDVPVGIHTGTGPQATPYRGSPNFRIALGNPLLLEDLLVRRPNLRVYIMHGGEPWTREAVALLQMYPQVYMDFAVIDWIGGPAGVPRFHEWLREMFDAGLGKRMMFGSDQMRWPDAIGAAIEAVRSADFLSEEQKQDLLYGNAARFLRLSEAEIARHHGRRSGPATPPPAPTPSPGAPRRSR